MQTLLVYNSGETGDVPDVYLIEGDHSELDGSLIDGGTVNLSGGRTRRNIEDVTVLNSLFAGELKKCGKSVTLNGEIKIARVVHVP